MTPKNSSVYIAFKAGIRYITTQKSGQITQFNNQSVTYCDHMILRHFCSRVDQFDEKFREIQTQEKTPGLIYFA